jgi:peroxiredoxin
MKPSIVKIRALALCVAAALLAAASVYAGNLTAVLPLPKELAATEIIPHFSAKDRSGEEPFQRRHLENMVRREPDVRRVALVYFATWCRPCAEGVRRLEKAKAELEANGVMAVLVNVGEGEENPEPVHRWVRTYGAAEFPLILDIRKQLVGPYGLSEANGETVMPKTLVLDSKLKPLFLLGTEGDDFPEILWKRNR